MKAVVKKSQNVIRGKVYILGDNIDTDLIIPAQYLNLVPTIPEEYRKLGSYAMAGLPDTYRRFVEKGKEKSEFSIIVAGKNFGCGSSREHAPVALGAAGVKAVLAETYARIFFRNAVATGELYPLETKKRLCDVFKTGNEAEIDLAAHTVTNLTTGKVFEFIPPGAVAPVIDAGGLFAYARKMGMIKTVDRCQVSGVSNKKTRVRGQRSGGGKRKAESRKSGRRKRA